MGQVEQELRLFDAHELVVRVQTGTWHQTVDVWMELQLLGPGMQGGDKTVDVRVQSFIGGQFFAQGPGGCLEEQLIGLLVT